MSSPVRILIAALGGEGGGVLAGWITDAAIADGFHAQRTSVPGVAQRTGSTTYYIEILKSEDRRPVMALSPSPGKVDLFISSELLEAARVVQAGLVTADRTFVISALHRVFSIHEKIAMGDGRADEPAMIATIHANSSGSALGDYAELARKAGCPLNAVLLGLVARQLPIRPDAFREAIRQDGRSVEANLRGFESGLADSVLPPDEPERRAAASIPAALAQTVQQLPSEARSFATEGVARLIDFQHEEYARLYLDRLMRFHIMPGADGALMGALARLLAVRMSSEDIVRVAQLKLRETRIARVQAEAKARSGDIVEITEFLKPGPAELLSILPERLARSLMGFVERRGWQTLSIPMKVRTTGLVGYLMLRGLAALKIMRPRSLRAAEENIWIERWLTLVERTLATDAAAALEVVQTANIVKGYGDTWANGHRNWERIANELIEPMLAAPKPHFADAVLQARIAALADSEGNRLGDVIESVGRVNS